jgi:hypothetical protein
MLLDDLRLLLNNHRELMKMRALLLNICRLLTNNQPMFANKGRMLLKNHRE